MSGTGLDVTLTVSGPQRPLPPALGLTVYRIVQEGLTNVLRHGGPAASARVDLHFAAGHLQLTVTDNGRGAAASPGPFGDDGARGHGLVGMRERVRVHGGTLATGPRQSGGFQVAVTLPLPPALDGPTAVGAGTAADTRPIAGPGVTATANDGPR